MNTALAIYENFQQTKDIANALANSDLVPPHFQRKPANILIALEFAQRNDIAPFQAMQSLYVVHGRVGMSAALAISLARKHNAWKRLVYKVTGEGETLAVTAVATLHEGGEASATVSYAQAKAAGWAKNPTYNSIPEQMLKYRAVTFLIRTHFPEVLFGLQTTDEIEDVEASKRAQPVTPETKVIDLPVNEKPEVKPEPLEVAQEIPEPVIEEDTLIENVEIEVERDIEDYRGELRDFLATRENSWFERIGKSREDVIAKIENENSLEKMKHFYEFVQKIGG